MWMKAVRLAPLRLAARKADWLGIGSLELDIYSSPRPLSAGDPAALFGLQDEPELNGQVRGRRSSCATAMLGHACGRAALPHKRCVKIRRDGLHTANPLQ
jgi:hypothetical protein